MSEASEVTQCWKSEGTSELFHVNVLLCPLPSLCLCEARAKEEGRVGRKEWCTGTEEMSGGEIDIPGILSPIINLLFILSTL